MSAKNHESTSGQMVFKSRDKTRKQLATKNTERRIQWATKGGTKRITGVHRKKSTTNNLVDTGKYLCLDKKQDKAKWYVVLPQVDETGGNTTRNMVLSTANKGSSPQSNTTPSNGTPRVSKSVTTNNLVNTGKYLCLDKKQDKDKWYVVLPQVDETGGEKTRKVEFPSEELTQWQMKRAPRREGYRTKKRK